MLDTSARTAIPKRISAVRPWGKMRPSSPKVSVVTCSHNRPELLRKAIESIRAQTDQDWEHLIYDDASSDPRVREVLEWAKLDPRVHVWYGKQNVDRPAALWNFMMDRAHGRYFTVLDDDNEKLPSFIEAMSRVLDTHKSIDIVTCGWRMDDEVSSVGHYHNERTNASNLRTRSTCDSGAMLYRREVFERAGYFSEDIRTNEDWEWLRRAVHNGKVKNLHEIHATYRNHGPRRMGRAGDLGAPRDEDMVRARVLSTTLGVTLVMPVKERLVQSQQDVCASTARALADIPWVRTGGAKDIALIVSPVHLSDLEVTKAARGHARVLFLHMEDPYALEPNSTRIRMLAQSSLAEVWVCTNDASTVPRYRQIVGDRVIVCSALGADDLLKAPARAVARDVDVLLCGYAYPSRRKFMAVLMPLLKGLRVMLVGDGWDEYAKTPGVTTMWTQPLEETYALHRRARAVVCLQRVRSDLNDRVDPTTVVRGFMEGYSGARVFVDNQRPNHGLDDGDVIFYRDADDLAGSLRNYLVDWTVDDVAAARFASKCRRLYTYRTRLARVLNCVRSPRSLAEIP